MRDAATILARFPGPVRLQLSFLRRLAGLAVCVGFVALFGLLIVVGQVNDWYDVMMTGLGLAIFGGLAVRAVVLLLAPGGARLTLDADGFETSTVFWHVRTHWRDAGNFRVVTDPDDVQPPLVHYDAIVPGETGLGVRETRHLPHDYSRDIHDLARVMNEWRRRALERP